MLTLFSTPKPWTGHIGVIQRNAVASWTRLNPAPEIILLGRDEGTAEAARELGVRHLPDVETNEHGTPLVSDLFVRAERAARHDLLCYVNADIILLPGLLEAVAAVAGRMRAFLLSGRRWNLDVTEPLAFAAGWEGELREGLTTAGTLFIPDAIDYFVFRRGLYPSMPPFAVGRTIWDNWLLFEARRRGAAVVDATEVVTVVHQNHDYAHHEGGKSGVWNGPEAGRNVALAGGRARCFTLADATHVLTRRGLRRPLDLRRLGRGLHTLDILRPGWRLPLAILRLPLRAIRFARCRLGRAE